MLPPGSLSSVTMHENLLLAPAQLIASLFVVMGAPRDPPVLHLLLLVIPEALPGKEEWGVRV